MTEAERPAAALRHLLELAGLPGSAQFIGADPVLPTRYRLGASGAAALAAQGLAANALWALNHPAQQVSVDITEAVGSLRGHSYLTVDGAKPTGGRDDLSGFYATGDGRHVFLHCNFPHIRDNNARIAGAASLAVGDVRAAVAKWRGEELETAIHAGGGVASFVRTPEEWDAHPHRAAVASLPVLEIEQIGDAPPQPLAAGPRPLSGIRTLDLTRVIAGPVACRTMAEHGADVLKISRRDLPGAGPLDIDTGIGKRSCFLDLREAGDNATLRALVQQGDIFIQSYRPGAMAGNGFGFDDLAAMRPGIVCATLSAWGRVGPWSGRRGYDTIVQSATGMAHFTGGAAGPALLPVSAIDYISGNIMAFGAMVALHRRATIGGSWLVRVSLAGVGHWMRSLGLLDADVAAKASPTGPDAAAKAMLVSLKGPLGEVRFPRTPLRLAATPPLATLPPVALGSHAPEWLARA